MTQIELLAEFRQLSTKEQLETLRAALQIIEAGIDETSVNDNQTEDASDREQVGDGLLALAGKFESAHPEVGRDHDHYLGAHASDNHESSV